MPWSPRSNVARVSGAARIAGAAGAAAAAYVWRRPEEVARLARGVLAARVGVPLDAVRWLVGALLDGRGLRGLELVAVPPGLRVGAELTLLGNEVRAAAAVYLDGVTGAPESMLLTLRLADVTLKLLRAEPDSPLATLLRSGALDLGRPGNLVAFMPRRPEYVVEARDDRVVLDLLRVPGLPDAVRRRLLPALTSLVAVAGVKTDWEHVDVLLHPFPRGVGTGFVDAARRLRGVTADGRGWSRDPVAGGDESGT